MSRLGAVVRYLGIVFTMLLAGLYLYVVWSIRARNPVGFWLLLGVAMVGAWLGYRRLTARARRRRQILRQPFPEGWRRLLEERVAFYRSLDADERHRFERDVQLFLGEKQVTGVGTEVDDAVRVLVAASAVIPVFGFPGWEYPNLQEVLIYPGAFSEDFEQTGAERDLLGMVGDGAMNRMMILSKPALLAGFSAHNDGMNTGLHEFIHLLDASDGDYNGVPAHFLEQRYAKPWLELLDREFERLRRGDSRLDPYGATNKEEFFAVAGEFFFERPALLKTDHPALYEAFTQLYRQDPLHRRLSGRAFRERPAE